VDRRVTDTQMVLVCMNGWIDMWVNVRMCGWLDRYVGGCLYVWMVG
jgi:hypothetical protein